MKPLETTSIRILSVVGMAMWLGGCSSLDPVALNRPIPQGRSIVFGSISVGSAGPKWLERGNVTVINTSNSKPVFTHPIKGLGGPFYWSMPPGHYAILDLYVYDYGWGGFSSRRIYAEFSIDSEQMVVYVGTLGLTPSSLSVTDDFDTAAQAFHTQFPALHTEPVKQLLHLEKQK